MDGSVVDNPDAEGFAGAEVADFVQAGEPAEFSPFAALGRLMRGRWLVLVVLAGLFGAGFGALGFTSGKKIYESQAILRISAREPGILFANGDDSKLKLFQSFVKAETTYVASHPVMQRAVEIIKEVPSPYNEELTARRLAESVSIRRKEALIVLKSASVDAEFAARKVNAVVDAYLALHEEGKEKLASFRESELATREVDLLQRLNAVKAQTLEVGGEFGMASLVKTHIEKVSQIEGLVARRAEVAATLAALESQTGSGSADMADQEIMRATLLDRALADLNFDKAKREAELSTLLRRYADGTSQVREKREEIAIIDRAMADRRQQIQVLGQTGALTEGGEASREESIAEIQALLKKVSDQLQTARDDARELNRKRIELTFLEEERDELRRMLDETRRALDVIRVESRNSMPGLVEAMSRGVVSENPAENTAKMLGAGGGLGGMVLAVVLVMGYGLRRGRFRFSDDLWRHVWQMPLLAVFPAKTGKGGDDDAVFRLRNAVLLFPSRSTRPSRRARIIAVSGLERAESRGLSRALADSFATARLNTLFIDANLAAGTTSDVAGWREVLTGETVFPVAGDPGKAAVLEAGRDALVGDASVSVRAVRSALETYAEDYAVIVVDAGSFGEGLSAELIASAADLVVGVVTPGDRLARLNDAVSRVATLPRHGAGFVVQKASRKDPGLMR